MLLQNLSSMVVIINSWIVTMWCVQRDIVFLSSFIYPGRLFMSNLVVFLSRKAEAYQYTWSMLPVFSGVWVAHLLCYILVSYIGSILIIMFFAVSVCLFSMFGLCPWITFFWFPLESWFPCLLFQKGPLFLGLGRKQLWTRKTRANWNICEYCMILR